MDLHLVKIKISIIDTPLINLLRLITPELMVLKWVYLTRYRSGQEKSMSKAILTFYCVSSKLKIWIQEHIREIAWFLNTNKITRRILRKYNSRIWRKNHCRTLWANPKYICFCILSRQPICPAKTSSAFLTRTW